MIAPSKNFAFLFAVAGLLMVSMFFLTATPFEITNLILGIVPLILLFCFGFTIWKAKRREASGDGDKP